LRTGSRHSPYLYGQLPTAALLALRHLGLSVDLYAAFVLTLGLLCASVYGGLGLLLFRRASDRRSGVHVSLALLLFGTATLTGIMDALPLGHPFLRLPVAFLDFLGAALFTLFLFVFLDGRFVPGWTRWVAPLWILWELPYYFTPGAPLDVTIWPVWLQIPFWLSMVGTVVVAQAYRYRYVSNAVQRQQTKWVLLGISAGMVGVFGLLAIWFGYFLRVSSMTSTGLGIALVGGVACCACTLLIPLSITIAILRFRLYEIETLLNRALVYSSLTATLTVVYVGSVLAGESLTRAITPNFVQSTPAIVVSTLPVAVLFGPLRRRLQAAIDRRFFRSKYDAARTLAAFAETMCAETDLSALTEELLAVIDETLQPTHVSLWLRPKEPI
jgi:hypothetical protein